MARDEVFRFLNVRPAQMVPEERARRAFASYGAGQSPLHQAIEQLPSAGAREAAVELASARLREDVSEMEAASAVIAAAQAATREATAGKARKEAEKHLGQKVGPFLAGTRARRLNDALWDRVYAHTLVPEERPHERDFVFDAVRALHALRILDEQADSDAPLTADDIARIRPLLPKGIIPGRPMQTEQRRAEREHAARAQLASVHGRIMEIRNAIAEIRDADRVQHARELEKVPDETGDVEEGGLTPLRRVALQEPAIAVRTFDRIRDAASERQRETLEETRMIVPRMQPWTFGAFASATLSTRTQELLASRRDRLQEQEIDDLVAAFREEQYAIATQYLHSLSKDALHFVRTEPLYSEILAEIAVPGVWGAPLPFPGSPPTTAAARGIQPLGVGDLLIVREELLRYVTGEVAHIENILKSEHKGRVHTRLRETEEIVITETERVQESEKDLQSTERFEMSRESQKTIESETSLEAGVSVTAGYGPVSVTAHADFAMSSSSSESNKNATTFAKDVTEKSTSRIRQRVREQRTRRSLERFEEKNEHGFDNKDGTGHVIGVYRWVDKHYRHRLINYGRRLMFEFIVPEPAAFYSFLDAGRMPAGLTLEKPVEPTASGHKLTPADLDRWNYTDFIAEYSVKGVEPHPADSIRISAAFAEAPAPGTPGNVAYAKTSEKLVIPDGYKGKTLWGVFRFQGTPGKFAICLVGGQNWGATAMPVQGVVPVSVMGFLNGFQVNIGVVCELKKEARAVWQQKTFDAIMTAYERKLADYNEQLTAASIRAGVQIQGRNPEFNRKIERDELRKGVLRQLTNDFAETRVNGLWRFNELFDSMQSGGAYGYPEAGIAEAEVEGRIIQFFEQAFEWNNMTYRFYPYFWGRKENWDEVFGLTDVDPRFIDFLRAGAARVIVPVHPAYDEAMLHYLATNEIWNGGAPPTLDDPLFVSLVDELRSDTGADLDGELKACSRSSGMPCQVNEWTVKLPTTLVYLQEDAKLPDFTT